jgi:hypothetical protein
MNTTKPASGCPVAHINANSGKVIAFLLAKVRVLYPKGRPLRIFHAKSIGLVEAEFIVGEDLPTHLKVGLFASPGRYKAWIRFTNGDSTPSPDQKKAVRGMAVKVLAVPGISCPGAEEPNVQDFVLINGQTFSPGSGDYALSAMNVTLGNLLQKIAALVRILSRYFSGSLLFLKYRIVTPNILEERYYSGTPYSFGKERAIKWHARPLKTITSVMPPHPKNNFLRDRLIRDLAETAKDPVAFDLLVQFQENEKTEPIDDCTVVWKTHFHRVATIKVPKQHITGRERLKLEKEMCFSPGNAITDHAPLGSINQVRVDTYRAMAHDRNTHPPE